MIKKCFFFCFSLLGSLCLQGQIQPEILSYPAFTWKSEVPADCPFPQSDEFSGIHFPGLKSGFRVGDTWYPTWPEDDRLYSPFTDGHCPRLDGGKDLSISDGVVDFGYGAERTSTGNAVMEGDDPTTLTIYSLGLSHASALPYHGKNRYGLEVSKSDGFLFQNFVFQLLRHRFQQGVTKIKYWRTKDKAEVDFIIHDKGEVIPVEVKFSELKKTTISRSFRSYIDKYQPAKAFLVSLSGMPAMILGKTRIEFIPFWHLMFDIS